MEKKSIILLIISIIVLCIAVVFAIWSFSLDMSSVQKENEYENKNILSATNKLNTVIQEESKTEDFSATYTDFIIGNEDGEEIKLSDYKNQPIMVLFLNNENEDSVEMLQRMNEQYDNYKEKI